MAMIRRASSGIALAARWALNTVSSSSSRPAVPLGARALGSSSSLPAVPLGPGSSSSALALFASRFLPFSTSSAADSPNSKQTGFGSSDDLDGLPFDSVDVDPADGTLFLERKTKHEIIRILVSKYDDILDDDNYWYPGGDLPGDDGNNDDDGDAIINEEDSESNDEGVDEGGIGPNEEELYVKDSLSNDEGVDEGDSEPNEEASGSNKEEVCGEDSESNEEDRLTMIVTILYGDNYDRCLEFFCHIFPDCHDQIFVGEVSFRKAMKSGEPVGPNHLDEFEGFFKKRGVEPGNINFLFNCIDKLNRVSNYCYSTAKEVLM